MIDQIQDQIKTALTPRNVIKFVVGGSVQFVVSTVIYKIVEPEDRLERGKTFVGSHVIAGMVTSKATGLVDQKLDAFAETVTEIKTAVVEAQSDTSTPNP